MKRIENLFHYQLCIASMFNFLGGYQNPEISFIQALPMIIMFLVFALSVGLYEEIVFRGFIFTCGTPNSEFTG